jgi:CRISPR-associated protein Csm2
MSKQFDRKNNSYSNQKKEWGKKENQAPAPDWIKTNPFNKKWIEVKIDKDGIEYLEELGKYLAGGGDKVAVTISQIRNVFGEVKRIEANLEGDENNWEKDFLFLRPKIAYAAARASDRNKNSRIKAFKEVLEKAHECVGSDPNKMKNFAKFLEAIVAYHKVYDGKE